MGKATKMDAAIGQRIRVQRMLAGISQTELADEISVTYQQLQKYEKGVNRISAGKLCEVAEVLKVKTAVLMGDA